MISQAVRNIFKNQVANLVKRESKNADSMLGQQLTELQSQVPTPDEIKEKLQASINKDVCSDKGMNKMRDKYDNLNSKLNKVENIIDGALGKLTSIEERVKPIIDESGPLKKLWEIVNFLNDEIVPILKATILVIEATLAINTALAASGSAISFLTRRQVKILGLVKEIAAIAIAVPAMIKYFKAKARKIINKLSSLKQKMQGWKDMIVKIKLFMYGLLTQLEHMCNIFNESSNISTTTVPPPTEDTTYNDYLALLEEYNKDIYQALVAAGNEKAIERVFALRENLEEDYNISFKVINIT